VNPRRLAILVALLPALALAADRKLTILFTGDNGGEIAPCG
jgi:hypothetical protein